MENNKANLLTAHSMGEMQSNMLKFAELVHYINTPKINLQS